MGGEESARWPVARQCRRRLLHRRRRLRRRGLGCRPNSSPFASIQRPEFLVGSDRSQLSCAQRGLQLLLLLLTTRLAMGHALLMAARIKATANLSSLSNNRKIVKTTKLNIIKSSLNHSKSFPKKKSKINNYKITTTKRQEQKVSLVSLNFNNNNNINNNYEDKN